MFHLSFSVEEDRGGLKQCGVRGCFAEKFGPASFLLLLKLRKGFIPIQQSMRSISRLLKYAVSSVSHNSFNFSS